MAVILSNLIRLFLGVVEDIKFANFHLSNADQGIACFEANNRNQGSLHSPTNATGTPKFKNIRIVNLQVNGGKVGWHLDGLPESFFQDVLFENISVDISNKDLWPKCHFIYGHCNESNVKPSCPPCLNTEGRAIFR